MRLDFAFLLLGLSALSLASPSPDAPPSPSTLQPRGGADKFSFIVKEAARLKGKPLKDLPSSSSATKEPDDFFEFPSLNTPKIGEMKKAGSTIESWKAKFNRLTNPPKRPADKLESDKNKLPKIGKRGLQFMA